MKGVISFLVASIFLLVLVSSAAKMSQRAPDVSYQPMVAMHLQEQAISAAFSDAMSDAASKALAVSQASGAGAEAPAAVKAAVYLSALDFERQLREAGYDAVFWCGKPSEASLQDASARMAGGGAAQGAGAADGQEWRAVVPSGALPLSNPACAASFDVNLLRKKVRVADAGFSFYSKGAAMGHAVLLPEGFGGEIDG
ncbi:MAG: hypothetical protein WC861_03640 [Candidatus Micrarchaeia archaeon]